MRFVIQEGRIKRMGPLVLLLCVIACRDNQATSGDSAASSIDSVAQDRTPDDRRLDTGTAGADTVGDAPDSVGAGAEPVAVLRGYYAAISARDYSRAYAAWGPGGPPGQPTLAGFTAGYATTDSVRLEIGTPGRVEGAAGSSYVRIPVKLHAYERGAARPTVYSGTYTLRRSVVPGASDASRRWHLYRATLVVQAADR